MKKFFALAMAVLMIFSLCSCVAKPQPAAPAADTKTTVRVAALKGPTGMGMVGLMDKNDKKETKNAYEFSLVSAPDEITGLIIGGRADIAAVPTNLASVLYNKTNGGVKLLALNTLGVLYILEKGDTIHSVNDLRGKTIYSSAQGSMTEYALNFILSANGIDPNKDVTIEYKSEHTELATLVSSGMADISMLPEPFVTTVLSKNSDIRIALDITSEWDKAAKGKSLLTMGCLVVSSEFAKNNPEALKAFLEEYSESVTFVNNDTAAASELIAKNGIVASADLAKKAIPGCNIVCITGAEMKASTPGFLEILFAANPQSVGGKLPGDDFYYEG